MKYLCNYDNIIVTCYTGRTFCLNRGIVMTKQIVRRDSLAEQVFEILKEELVSGKYAPGQKLMSESAIAQKYGVSRLTVRAAIARLNALDYVETRNGEGSFVKEHDNDRLLQTVSTMVLEPQMLNDVSDFRRLIDIECVRLAILNCTSEGLQRLYDACEEFSAFVHSINVFDEEAQKTIVNLDYKYHLTMCELSGNLLYPLVYKAAQEAIKQQICTNVVSRWYFNRLDTSNHEDIERFIMTHFELFNAVKNGDLAKAKRLSINHIDLNVMKLPNKKTPQYSGAD